MAPQLGLQPFVPDPADRRLSHLDPPSGPRPAAAGAGLRRPLAVARVGAVWWLAHALRIAEGEQFALAFMLQAVLLAVLGWPVYRALLFPFAYLLLMVPTGDFLLGPLQGVATQVASFLLRLTGIPVFVEGTIIEVPTRTVIIAPGCAGLNFLLASLALSLLFADLLYRHWPKRVVCVVAALALSVAANWVRIYALIVFDYFTDSRTNIFDDHLLYGWGFFTIIMALLLWLAHRLQDPVASEPAPRYSAGRLRRAGGRHSPSPRPRRSCWPAPFPGSPPCATARPDRRHRSRSTCRRRSGTGVLPPGPGRRRRPGSRKPATCRNGHRIEVRIIDRPAAAPGSRVPARRKTAATGGSWHPAGGRYASTAPRSRSGRSSSPPARSGARLAMVLDRRPPGRRPARHSLAAAAGRADRSRRPDGRDHADRRPSRGRGRPAAAGLRRRLGRAQVPAPGSGGRRLRAAPHVRHRRNLRSRGERAIDRALLGRMNESPDHRGPDGEGVPRRARDRPRPPPAGDHRSRRRPAADVQRGRHGRRRLQRRDLQLPRR